MSVYRLVKVNGTEIPGPVDHDGTALVVASGVFTIRGDGTCVSETVFTPPGGSETARKVEASYERSGAKLTMQWKGAGVTEGSVTGNTFVMDNHGMIFEYVRTEHADDG